MLSILLLAAGQSSRMRGQDKLMQEVDGAPLIRTMAMRALATGCPVTISFPANSTDRLRAVADLDFSSVQSRDSDNGMAHSIRAGLAALPGNCDAVMIVPADMPELESDDFLTMIRVWSETDRNKILRGTSAGGKPGHPVIFPKTCFDALSRINGDEGARSVLAKNPEKTLLIPLPANHAITDLDTPEDWKAWRSSKIQAR